MRIIINEAGKFPGRGDEMCSDARRAVTGGVGRRVTLGAACRPRESGRRLPPLERGWVLCLAINARDGFIPSGGLLSRLPVRP